MTNSPSGLQPLENCPSCQSPHKQKLVDIPSSSVYECRQCHLRFLNPCLSPKGMIELYTSEGTLASLNACHEGYYDYGSLDTPSESLREFNAALDRLETLYDPKTKPSVLDIGFGNGFFLAAAQKRGWEVDGIDSSLDNVDIAKRKFGLALKQDSFETFLASPNSYDVISFWHVVEHIPKPEEALRKAYDLLKPGGCLLIGVPNDNSFLSYLSWLLYRVSFGFFKKGINRTYFLEHVSYFNAKTLATLVERLNFKCIDVFFSSTDLKKFKFSFLDRILANIILMAGKLLGLQNRLVALFKKQ